MKEQLPGMLLQSVKGDIFPESDRTGLGSRGQGKQGAVSVLVMIFSSLPPFPPSARLGVFLPIQP